jgi:hypothetical protein
MLNRSGPCYSHAVRTALGREETKLRRLFSKNGSTARMFADFALDKPMAEKQMNYAGRFKIFASVPPMIILRVCSGTSQASNST